MFNMEDNLKEGARTLDVDITVDNDDAPFLAIHVDTDDGNVEVADWVTTDPAEIAQFFSDVDDAKSEWERMKAGQ